MCGAVGFVFFHLIVVILIARDTGRLLAILGQKRKRRKHVFSQQKPKDGACIQ